MGNNRLIKIMILEETDREKSNSESKDLSSSDSRNSNKNP
jgi:hypothetical protein